MRRLNTTMIYARAHDQTVAEDYFTAMQRIEQRLDIAPEPEPGEESMYEVPRELGRAQLLVWATQLAQPQLRVEERLRIVTQLRSVLSTEQKRTTTERKYGWCSAGTIKFEKTNLWQDYQ